MQAIEQPKYSVAYEPETATVNLQGSMRLGDMREYGAIEKFLNQVIEQEPPVITLNLQNLKFCNSSGINMLSKFVINAREQNKVLIVVKGSTGIPWQGKSLKNLQRLMPSLTLELE